MKENKSVICCQADICFCTTQILPRIAMDMEIGANWSASYETYRLAHTHTHTKRAPYALNKMYRIAWIVWYIANTCGYE